MNFIRLKGSGGRAIVVNFDKVLFMRQLSDRGTSICFENHSEQVDESLDDINKLMNPSFHVIVAPIPERRIDDDPTEMMKAAWQPKPCDCMAHVCMKQKGRKCQWPIETQSKI